MRDGDKIVNGGLGSIGAFPVDQEFLRLEAGLRWNRRATCDFAEAQRDVDLNGHSDPRTMTADRLPTQLTSELAVLQKADFFVDAHLWPETQYLNPRGWLQNFTSKERPFAAHALDSFMFFSEPLCDALMRAAFQSLSAPLTKRASSLAEAKTLWRQFLVSVVVSFVTGETPNPSDSGHVYARKARQLLTISEHQIKAPEDAVVSLAGRSDATILLVDDFVGSGDQMHATWHRHYSDSSGKGGSFRSLNENGARVIYLPLVATSRGLSRLNRDCPGLEVRPAHELGVAYSLTSDQSHYWPADIRAEAMVAIEAASRRAGIIAGAKYGWKGFSDLGLGLAFWNSVPDSTLPLFHWEAPDWTPLVRRT